MPELPTSPSTLHELARAPARRGEFIEVASRYLRDTEHDPAVALALVQALVEAGLGAPARELVAARRELAPSEAPGLREGLAALPSGTVPWSETERRFEDNLAALLDRRPDLEAQATALRTALRDCLLHRARDGRLRVSRRAPNGVREWIPLYHDPTRGMPFDDLRAASSTVCVVNACGTTLPQRAYAATRPADGAVPKPIYLVEHDLERLAAWMHVRDRTLFLRDERVHCFIGATAGDDFEATLHARADVAVPEFVLGLPGDDDAVDLVVEATRRITAHRDALMAQHTATLRERDASRSAADLADRLAPGATILGFTSLHTTMTQHAMRDIAHACAALGYRFHISIESSPSCAHSTLTAAQEIVDVDPALVVLINHYRHEMPQSFGAVPILTWAQDPTEVVLSRATGAAMGAHDFVCGYYRKRCVTEFGFPEAQYYAAPLPVSERLFHDAPIATPEAPADATVDLVYVGHLHRTADEHRAWWRETSPAVMHPLVDAIHDHVARLHAAGEHLGQRPARALVREIAAGTTLNDDQLEHLANYGAFRYFDILYRVETLRWAAAWAAARGRTFRVYGDGWERVPEIAPFAAGPVEHGEPLRRVYRASRLALQTIPGGYKHQRTYEALLSGALVLGRLAPERDARQEEAFPEIDLVTFRDHDACVDCLDRWIDDDDARHATRERFAEVVRASRTYAATLPAILDRIREQLRTP